MPLKRHSVKKGSGFIYVLLAVTLFALVLLSICWGRFHISMSEFLTWIHSLSAGTENDTITHVMLGIRIPRIFAAVLVGMALSSAGSSYQGVFRNPMVSPDILGASAGAGFGASLAIIYGLPTYMIQIISFAFGLIAVLASCLLSWLSSSRGSKTLVMILSGMVVSALFNAFISIIKYTADPYSQLPEITFWLMGGLSDVTAQGLIATIVPFSAGLLVLMLIRWRINVLSLGEEDAMALGINPGLVRGIVVCCATLLTSLAISICGQIGWVGLVVPHMARMLTGPNYRRLLPATALLGGIFLLAVDNISRNLAVIEIPLGILTAVTGAPIFVFLLLRGKRGWL
ncbi:MAG: FecCD family ABC transporter permease [Oscillospiraceae bacterium]